MFTAPCNTPNSPPSTSILMKSTWSSPKVSTASSTVTTGTETSPSSSDKKPQPLPFPSSWKPIAPDCGPTAVSITETDAPVQRRTVSRRERWTEGAASKAITRPDGKRCANAAVTAPIEAPMSRRTGASLSNKSATRTAGSKIWPCSVHCLK